MQLIQVAAVILHREGKVLIALRSEDAPFYKLKWEFAGGKLDNKKDPTIEHTAIRETEEELGIELEIESLEFLTRFKWEGEFNPFLITFYFVREFEGEPVPKVAKELKWIPLEDLEKYDFIPTANVAFPVIRNHWVAEGLDKPQTP